MRTCARTCSDKHSATLYHFLAVVREALVHTQVFAVDDSELQSVGFDADAVVTSESLSILKPGDVGSRLPRHLTFHDIT